MLRDVIIIDGKEYRVELNWNAIVSYLQAAGKDDMLALADFRLLKPSDLTGLLAAGINEGQRLDGKEERFTAEEVGQHANLALMATFLEIFNRQMQPQVAVKEEEAKKKA